MASPLDALQTRIGPAPAWLWIAGGGAALYLGSRLGLFGGKAARASTAGPARAAPPLTVVAPQAPTPSPARPATTGQAQVRVQSIWGAGQAAWVFATPADASVIGIAPADTVLSATGPAVPGGSHTANGVTSTSWQPVGWAGTTAYLWGPEAVPVTPAQLPGQPGGVATFGGGEGGPSRGAGVRSSVQRRQDTHWSWHGNPDLKLEHVAPHSIVAGVGGAGLHPVARRAGIAPARLIALNPRAHPAPGRGGADDGVGGFTDAYVQPSYASPRYGRQGGPDDSVGGPDDQGGGGAFRGVRRRLRGRPQQVAASRGVGGPDDSVGGAQGATIPGSDIAHYRLPRVPLGHSVRAGELIRIR